MEDFLAVNVQHHSQTICHTSVLLKVHNYCDITYPLLYWHQIYLQSGYIMTHIHFIVLLNKI